MILLDFQANPLPPDKVSAGGEVRMGDLPPPLLEKIRNVQTRHVSTHPHLNPRVKPPSVTLPVFSHRSHSQFLPSVTISHFACVSPPSISCRYRGELLALESNPAGNQFQMCLQADSHSERLHIFRAMLLKERLRLSTKQQLAAIFKGCDDDESGGADTRGTGGDADGGGGGGGGADGGGGVGGGADSPPEGAAGRRQLRQTHSSPTIRLRSASGSGADLITGELSHTPLTPPNPLNPP